MWNFCDDMSLAFGKIYTIHTLFNLLFQHTDFSEEEICLILKTKILKKKQCYSASLEFFATRNYYMYFLPGSAVNTFVSRQ